jgi:5-formyltetrahydrofolate cyclo-ligase
MPLVAFDPSGNRLGMGGGFYDRTFSYLRNRKFWTKPLLIGIAYEFQRLDSLTPSPWDVPLQAIATEKSLHLFDSLFGNALQRWSGCWGYLLEWRIIG